jgi:hypothetical protein
MAGDAVYCPACGQSVKEITRPWLSVVGELFKELFDFDGRMLQSMRLLLSRPGFLSHEFINGRRASYTSPVRIYLIVSVGFFLLLPMIIPEDTAPGPGHTVSVDLYSKAMFLLLPFFALLLKMFYRRSFYLAHLVFAVHLFSVMYIALAPMMALESTTDRYLAAIAPQVILLVYMIAYCLIALRTTYQEGWPKTVLKFFGLTMLFLPLLGGAIELASHTDLFFNGSGQSVRANPVQE